MKCYLKDLRRVRVLVGFSRDHAYCFLKRTYSSIVSCATTCMLLLPHPSSPCPEYEALAVSDAYHLIAPISLLTFSCCPFSLVCPPFLFTTLTPFLPPSPSSHPLFLNFSPFLISSRLSQSFPHPPPPPNCVLSTHSLCNHGMRLAVSLQPVSDLTLSYPLLV